MNVIDIGYGVPCFFLPTYSISKNIYVRHGEITAPEAISSSSNAVVPNFGANHTANFTVDGAWA